MVVLCFEDVAELLAGLLGLFSFARVVEGGMDVCVGVVLIGGCKPNFPRSGRDGEVHRVLEVVCRGSG